MPRNRTKTSTRRDFLKLAATAGALGPFFSFPDRAFASQQTLKIAKWAHFLPEFDAWFEGMAKEWGRQHDTRVSVDEIPVENVYAQAKAEAKAGQGHDVFIFPWPPAEFQQDAIDHGELYNRVAMNFGAIPQIANASTLNVNAKRYFAFADFWVPFPFVYVLDSWAAVKMANGPLTYGSLRLGAQRVRENAGVPCGLSLTPTLEGNITTNTLLYAFGGPIINRRGKIEITVPTLEALDFAKRLYREAGALDQLSWGPAGNVQAMLAGKASCTMNGISLLRLAEKQNPALSAKIRVAPPLMGSYGVTAFPHVTNCSLVWNFSKNQAQAKEFIVDLPRSSRTSYEQSLGCNFPVYPKTVPNLIVRLEKDAVAVPPDKYTTLKDALHWTPNLGAPWIATPTWMETFNTFVIPRMFAQAVKGEHSVADAARAAEAEIHQIAEKWKDV